jgi:AcrR family transcriptional regulator
MATHPATDSDTRAPLSRERVLRTAVELADAGGIDSLTMRRLAQELGVEAMSLYHHVRNKDDILEGIVELVMAEIEVPSAGDDWRASIRRMAVSAYEILVRHPWSASLILGGSGVSPGRLRYMETILGTLRRAGFSAEMTDHAYHALDSHIMGFTLWQVGMNLGTPEDLHQLATAFREQVAAQDLPYVVEHIDEHLKERSADDEGDFAFGLDLILDGLDRLRTTTAG